MGKLISFRYRFEKKIIRLLSRINLYEGRGGGSMEVTRKLSKEICWRVCLRGVGRERVVRVVARFLVEPPSHLLFVERTLKTLTLWTVGFSRNDTYEFSKKQGSRKSSREIFKIKIKFYQNMSNSTEKFPLDGFKK